MTTEPVSKAAFSALGDNDFVSLTTYRKNGVAVPTPVWIARDGDALVVTTPEESGKVKRLRHNASVELAPSSRRGVVEPDAVPVPGVARIVTDEQTNARLTAVFRKKYSLEYRIFMIIERIVARGNRDRVILRITAV